MTKRERVLAAVHGEKPDRTPISLWRHWPKDDQSAESLARDVLDWQARYDFDFIKVTPTSGYAEEDWGARFAAKGNCEGTRERVERPVKSLRGWAKLEPLDVKSGVLGRELQALRLIRVKAGPDLFILQTIFSPLTIARSLAGEELWLNTMHDHPQELRRALSVIADSYGRFSEECLRAGADGIFFATQCASFDILTEDEYSEFGIPYDRHVLGVAADKGSLTLLHMHGLNVMFDLLAGTYPAHILNWHDRLTPPTLAEAQKKAHTALMGGIDEWHTLNDGTPEQVTAEVQDAIKATGGRGFLVGAGCVVPIDTPEANLRAARAAVESAT